MRATCLYLWGVELLDGRKKISVKRLRFSIRWCRGGESNPHSFRNRILSPARLPIPPPRQRERHYAKWFWFWQVFFCFIEKIMERCLRFWGFVATKVRPVKPRWGFEANQAPINPDVADDKQRTKEHEHPCGFKKQGRGNHRH